MADRFLIAPYDKDNYADPGIIINLTKGSVMAKVYKDRVDTIDMIGKRSGKLLVISLHRDHNQRGAQWLCKCDCGNETIATGHSLRRTGSKARKSCGCLAEKNIEDTGINRLISYYMTKCNSKKREFGLTRKQFITLIKGNCFYCNIPPSQVLKRLKTDKIQVVYNGIDRLDSSIGYVNENCVSACRYCNQAKSTLSIDQFKDHIKRIYQWLQIDSL
jgi:5-methylcytosine-specific restriction endonuclease McrA